MFQFRSLTLAQRAGFVKGCVINVRPMLTSDVDVHAIHFAYADFETRERGKREHKRNKRFAQQTSTPNARNLCCTRNPNLMHVLPSLTYKRP